MIQQILLAGFAAATSASAATYATIPVAALTPWITRAASRKPPLHPDCAWTVIAATRDNVVCARPDVDWASYDHVEIGSIEIAAADAAKHPTQQQSAALHDALAKSLRRRFAADSAPGGKGLRLSAKVTALTPAHTSVNVVSMLLVQAPLSFGAAVTTFDLSDAKTGEALGEVTMRGRGRVFDLLPSLRAYGHARKVLERAPKQMSKDLQLIRKSATVTLAGEGTKPTAGGK